MSKYIIIGGDGKEYGPKTETEIRAWIEQGRLDASSQIKDLEENQWKTIQSIPHFAGALNDNGDFHSDNTPPEFNKAPLAASTLTRVNGPAISMMILALICIPLALFGMTIVAFPESINTILPDMPAKMAEQMEQLVSTGAVGITQYALSLIANITILIGAVRMRKCRSYGLALTASILCLLCNWSCFCLGPSIGIWALIVLCKPEVKGAFH